MPVPAEVETPQQQANEVATPAPSAPIPINPAEETPQEQGEDASNGSASPIGEGVVNGDGGKQQQAKLFVGALSETVNEEKLREVFKDFGEVIECKVMRDHAHPNKRSRGFGFVTFDNPDSVTKVINSHRVEPILIDNKEIDPKEAVPPKRLRDIVSVKRIFVGGISSDSEESDLKNYFKQFGKVCDCQLMFDRNTKRHRGFGFVSFETEEPAEKACSIQYHDIKGKKVEVKIAQTKEALALQNGKRPNNGRNNYGNVMYSSYGPAQNQFYPASPTYAPDYMAMGGYTTAPYLISNGMRKPPRGAKTQDYPQQYPAFMFGGWAEPSRMTGGFYGPPGYGGMPIAMYRGHPGMDPNMIIPTSGMDYVTDQFQGMALGGYPPSPMGQYPPMTHSAGMAHVNEGNASGSPQELSPTATSSVNTFGSQVPPITGSTYNGTNNVGQAF